MSGKGDAFLRGAGQGASLGWADEIAPELAGLIPMPDDGTGIPREYAAGDRASDMRQNMRDEDANAASKYPLNFGAGAMLGAAPAAIATGGQSAGAAVASGVGLGALGGAGAANGQNVLQQAVKGGALGGAMGAAAPALGAVGPAVRDIPMPPPGGMVPATAGAPGRPLAPGAMGGPQRPLAPGMNMSKAVEETPHTFRTREGWRPADGLEYAQQESLDIPDPQAGMNQEERTAALWKREIENLPPAKPTTQGTHSSDFDMSAHPASQAWVEHSMERANKAGMPGVVEKNTTYKGPMSRGMRVKPSEKNEALLRGNEWPSSGKAESWSTDPKIAEAYGKPNNVDTGVVLRHPQGRGLPIPNKTSDTAAGMHLNEVVANQRPLRVKARSRGDNGRLVVDLEDPPESTALDNARQLEFPAQQKSWQPDLPMPDVAPRAAKPMTPAAKVKSIDASRVGNRINKLPASEPNASPTPEQMAQYKAAAEEIPENVVRDWYVRPNKKSGQAMLDATSSKEGFEMPTYRGIRTDAKTANDIMNRPTVDHTQAASWAYDPAMAEGFSGGEVPVVFRTKKDRGVPMNHDEFEVVHPPRKQKITGQSRDPQGRLILDTENIVEPRQLDLPLPRPEPQQIPLPGTDPTYWHHNTPADNIAGIKETGIQVSKGGENFPFKKNRDRSYWTDSKNASEWAPKIKDATGRDVAELRTTKPTREVPGADSSVRIRTEDVSPDRLEMKGPDGAWQPLAPRASVPMPTEAPVPVSANSQQMNLPLDPRVSAPLPQARPSLPPVPKLPKAARVPSPIDAGEMDDIIGKLDAKSEQELERRLARKIDVSDVDAHRYKYETEKLENRAIRNKATMPPKRKRVASK